MRIFVGMELWKRICSRVVAGMLAAASLVACEPGLDPVEEGGVNPAVSREGVEGLGYEKVMILYSEGYNNLSKDLSENIEQLCGGWIPARNSKYAVVVYSHSSVSAADYTTRTQPVIYRMYKDFSKVVKDTIKTYDSISGTMEPTFMRNVLTTIRQQFPASSYGLVYTSHGNGWIPASYTGESTELMAAPSWVGAQFERSSSNCSSMDIDDFHDAIPYHLEYIAFDACLMGGVEVAYELKDVCDWIVASPTEVITDGFCYPTMTERLLCEGDSDLQGLCSDYYSMCENDSYATIGLYDCSKMQALADACKPVFAAHRDNVLSINPNLVQSYNYTYDYNYDFRDMIAKMGATDEELASVDAALEDVVVYKKATTWFITVRIDQDRYCGIGTYLPESSRTNLNALYKETAWDKATGLL